MQPMPGRTPPLASAGVWDVVIKMMMDPAAKGAVTTVNVTSHGPLMEYLAERKGRDIVMVQETYVVADRLPAMQAQALDCGFQGVWATAIPTTGAGSQGGVAILAPTHIQVTAPPGRASSSTRLRLATQLQSH